MGRSADNADRLLDRALDLVVERGWSAVGVQDIAAAAGVTKPTLYHWFGSKRGLLDALLARELGPFLDQLEAAVVYRGDIHQSLGRVVATNLGFATEHARIYRIVVAFAVAAPFSEERGALGPLAARRHALLVRLFTDAAAHHTNLAGHHRTFALTLQGMLDVHILAALDAGSSLDDGLRYRIVKQFMYGMWSL